MTVRKTVDRRHFLTGMASLTGLATPTSRAPYAAETPLRFGLTPVFLTSDLVLLDTLKTYLSNAMARPVQLVSRRTYQEITALLVSRQLDAAWICGYPFVAFLHELALVAVPIWNGKPLYQSYLIAGRGTKAEKLADLAGTVHAFSDPDSNSGYLVTRAALAEMGTSPTRFFRQFFYTYGHRNVIRAVSSGLGAAGSVDGYVYDVLAETEPELAVNTRIIAKSELLGFPPVAYAAEDAGSPTTVRLRDALVRMAVDPHGRAVLQMLRLDGFSTEAPELFDGIAAKMTLVRRTPE